MALRLWLGFPKSLDISKAIDKKLGAERNRIKFAQSNTWREKEGRMDRQATIPDNNPATPEAKQWKGWGTCLKPANEPIVLARKPISEKTIAENVLKWGTGGLNIDGCRIGDEERTYKGGTKLYEERPWTKAQANGERARPTYKVSGRFPANVILDEEAGRMLDEQSGITRSGKVKSDKGAYGGVSTTGFLRGITTTRNQHGDSGGASRFFYCAKASRSERTMGGKVENNHPTVKPIKLMRYLCRLITPPGGTVLDPFAGSGATILAAIQEGFSCIGIEKEPEYCNIIRQRMAAV